MSEVVDNVAEVAPIETPTSVDPSVAAVTPTPSFAEMLSPDIREQGNLKDFKSADDLAKSYVEMSRMVGNSVRMPSVDSSPEARKDFLDKIKDIDGVLLKDDEKLFDKLGRPETADGYKLEELIPEEYRSEDLSVMPEIQDFKSIAHEIGLTDAQAKRLVEMRMGSIQAMDADQQAKAEAAQAELHKIWGQDFDNRLSAARQVAKIYSEKYGDHMDSLINSPVGNNPAFLNILSELASVYKEKGHDKMSNTEFGTTPEMAKAKITEKESDRGFMEAYLNRDHPGHAKAVADMRKLHQLSLGVATD